VAGADEAGRGCLAGPLVAAAVCLDLGGLSRTARRSLTGLDDSKRLTPAERQRLAAVIPLAAERVEIVICPAPRIDRRGLHRCNLEALGTALERAAAGHVAARGPVCLVDGYSLPGCGVEHRRLVKGDSHSAAIAAASVMAKATRDGLMHRAADRLPGWGFEEHVGYGTAAHLEAITRLGVSPLHRLSFSCSAYPTA